MFGMLDYRAHKLYWLLTLPINIPLRLMAMFAVPFIDYAIGKNFGSERVWEIAITIAIIFPIELIWTLIVKIISKMINGIFSFLVDVEPANGRTKEEAQVVVWNGETAIHALSLEQNPDFWTDEAIESVTKGDLIGRVYAKNRRKRIFALRNYYQQNPEISRNEYEAKKFLKENGIEPSLFELIISNQIYRLWTIAYGFLLWLIIINPMN